MWTIVESNVMGRVTMRLIKGHEGRLLGLALLAVAFVAFASPARAISSVTNISNGGSVSYADLVGTNVLSVQVGDKLFSNFTFQFLSTDMSLGNNVVPSDLAVSALFNQFGEGLSIQLVGFNVSNMNSQDIALTFSAQVVGTGNLISGLDLSVNGGTTVGGLADVSENVYTHGIGAGNIANLAVAITSSSASYAESVVTFAPQPIIYIEKDLGLSANAGGGCGTAFISIVNQTFAQVPEPSTIFLLAMGITGLWVARRRK